MSVNKVILIGNLGRDPELRYTNTGSAVCNLSLATTRTWYDKAKQERQEETEWHTVVVWGQQGEHCNNYLAKGRQVYIEGRLRTRSYDKDGIKRYSTEIIAETVKFIGGRGGEAGGGGGRRKPSTYDPSGYDPGDYTPTADNSDDLPF